MTKDGLDVTNSASRGSKTKEQRDHAHLMRIIKACESCKKKKIRCDPSHKKKAAAAAAAAAAPVAKPSKKAKAAVPREQSVAGPARLSGDMMPPPAPSLPFSPFPALDSVDEFPQTFEAAEPWEDFIHYPQDMDLDMGIGTDYDFFFDPQGFLSPVVSDSSPSSFTDSMPKSTSPTSQPEYNVPSSEKHKLGTDAVAATDQSYVDPPQRPYMDLTAGGSTYYTDFNLYSPQSSFSEDERMLSVGSSSTPSTSAEGSQLRSPQDRPPLEYAPRDYVQDVNATLAESGFGQVDSLQDVGFGLQTVHDERSAMSDEQWHRNDQQLESSYSELVDSPDAGLVRGARSARYKLLATRQKSARMNVVGVQQQTVSIPGCALLKRRQLTCLKDLGDSYVRSQVASSDQSVRRSAHSHPRTQLTRCKKTIAVDSWLSSRHNVMPIDQNVRTHTPTRRQNIKLTLSKVSPEANAVTDLTRSNILSVRQPPSSSPKKQRLTSKKVSRSQFSSGAVHATTDAHRVRSNMVHSPPRSSTDFDSYPDINYTDTSDSRRYRHEYTRWWLGTVYGDGMHFRRSTHT